MKNDSYTLRNKKGIIREYIFYFFNLVGEAAVWLALTSLMSVKSAAVKITEKIVGIAKAAADFFSSLRKSMKKRRRRKIIKRGKLIKRSVVRRLLLSIIAMTAAYFGVYIIIQSGGLPVISEIYLNTVGTTDFYFILYELELVIIIGIYLILVLFIINRAFNKFGEYLDSIDDALDNLSEGREIEREMPSELSDYQMKITNILYTVQHNEQAAREAEQRKNDLVVYLAHDLKTPLTSVIGYLSLLEECPELDINQRAKYVKITLDKALRLEQLINEFFDITRFNLQSITLDNNSVNITRMLYQIADEFYPVFEEKSLKCNLNIAGKIEFIGDADKLARVFDNLIRNAVNYSYSGTTVDISAVETGNMINVSVRNIGDCIPQAKLERIFEKFFRVDSARTSSSGGAGLGLAIAKQIVELHGGTISAESSAKFTQFTVSLPKNRQVEGVSRV
ncbi:MAG: HAMP domain-containing sensor histidine kinase [Firmicutes bacterium]|nr:HAMP domain-containing sensor histidine kinase [Bacillota bacterium]